MEQTVEETRQVRRARERKEKKEAEKAAKLKARIVTIESGGFVRPRTLSFRQRLRNGEDMLRRTIMLTSALSSRVTRLEDLLADLTLSAEGQLVAGPKLEEWYAERKTAEADALERAAKARAESESENGDNGAKPDEPEGTEETPGVAEVADEPSAKG